MIESDFLGLSADDAHLDPMKLPVDSEKTVSKLDEIETEEDGIRAEAIRREKVRRLFKGKETK